MKKYVVISVLMTTCLVVSAKFSSYKGFLKTSQSIGLFQAMDSFVAAEPDAISDFVYDVEKDGHAEFGWRLCGRPEFVPENCDGDFPEGLARLSRAVTSAGESRPPKGVYRSYMATGSGQKFTDFSHAYRLEYGRKVEDFEINNALAETQKAQGYSESGAYRVTEEEYVCAQYYVETFQLIFRVKLEDIANIYQGMNSSKAQKIKVGERILKVRVQSDPKAKKWREVYDLMSGYVFKPDYIKVYYNRAKRYIYIADKKCGKLYVAAYRSGKFYLGETTGTDLPRRWIDVLK